MTAPEDEEICFKNRRIQSVSIKAEDVLLDFWPTANQAMRSSQWAGWWRDDSYAGSRVFIILKRRFKIYRFQTCFPPSGRAAEKILFNIIGPGKMIWTILILTQHEQYEFVGSQAHDFPSTKHDRLLLSLLQRKHECADRKNSLAKGTDKIPWYDDITNNTWAASPSLWAISESKSDFRKNKIPFFLDACRLRKAYFIKLREKAKKPHGQEIAQEVFRLADGATCRKKEVSSKGGFLALNDDKWATKPKNLSHLTEDSHFAAWAGAPEAYPWAQRSSSKKIIWNIDPSVQYTVKTHGREFPSVFPPWSSVIRRSSVFATYSSWRFRTALSCALYQAGESRLWIGRWCLVQKSPDKYEGWMVASLCRRLYAEPHHMPWISFIDF